MNTDQILSNINNSVPLNQEETALLESMLIPRPFKQGELIVRSGEQARYLMFVNSGYLMTYFTDDTGADHVIHFASTGWWVSDIYSMGKDPLTRFTTKGLCDGELLLLPRPAQKQLLETNIKFERYFRITFQNSVLRQQMRIIDHNTKTARTTVSSKNSLIILFLKAILSNVGRTGNKTSCLPGSGICRDTWPGQSGCAASFCAQIEQFCSRL